MFAAKKLSSAVNAETAKGFDWTLNAKKALMNFAIVCGAVAVSAIADYLMVPQNVALLFQWLPESVRATALGMLAPLIAAAAFSLKNWAKNRDNQVVMVVPVATPSAAPIPVVMKPPIPPATVPTIPASDAGVS